LDIQGLENIEKIRLGFYKDNQQLFSFMGTFEELQNYGILLTQDNLSSLATAIKQSTNSVDLGQVNVKLEIADKVGKKYYFEDKAAVNSELNDYEIGRINLIVFDFDRAELSTENKQLLQQFGKREDW